MSRTALLVIASVLVIRHAGAVCAAEPNHTPALIARATAEQTALRRVPGGTIQEGELETEHGRRVWSFDIAQPSSRNITEVQVDATTGEIVSIATETPDDQAKEAAADRKSAPK